MNTLVILELVKIWSKRLDIAEVADKIRAISLLLEGAPYVWGSENPGGTDCSGTVCFALWALGYNIRTTADVLYREIYTRKPSNEQDLSKVMAVFYITKKDKIHYNRPVKAGTCTHVTPVVGKNVVLNAAGKVTLETARSVREYFEARDSFAEWREIDWGKVDELNKSGRYAWGFDPVLELIRKSA